MEENLINEAEFNKKIIEYKAFCYATECHASTNHLYDGRSYTYHLAIVEANANKFLHLIPEEDRHSVLATCWCHDVIEDTRQTYNDVKKATNEQVAEIVYALTNEKGRNRKERANDKYYRGIRQTPYATFVKLCDRIANVQHSISTKSRMLEMYQKEQQEFFMLLNDGLYSDMWIYLDELLDY
jgi:(p)ppGpp synthase/HD superfamily hydrolase